MSNINDRGTAFENKFVHDEKINFKIEARACKLLGLWAAEKLSLTGDDALAYAADAIEANLEEPGFHDILRKIKSDFEAKKVEVSEHTLQTQLTKLIEQAKGQIITENK